MLWLPRESGLHRGGRLTPVPAGSGPPLSLDPVRNLGWRFMLPGPDHEPTAFGKKPVVAGVPLPIGLQLGFPPVGVGFRCNTMVGASVPETAIDLDDDTGASEHDVGLPWHAPHVHPEP